MGTIVCATRGGEASYQTQDKVIEMAKANDDDLVFVFAVNTRFLDKTAAPVLVDVEPEMENLAEFLMLMAQERAKKSGVEAEMSVKQGTLRDVLVETAAEREATQIVLGSPAEGGRYNMENLQVLADDLEEATGSEVLIV